MVTGRGVEQPTAEGDVEWESGRVGSGLDSWGNTDIVVAGGHREPRPEATAQRMASREDEFRDLLGIAFECFPMGAVIMGLDGAFLHVNPAVCKLLGRSAEELLRHKISDFFEPGQRAAAGGLAALILDQGLTNYREEREFMRPDGSRIRLDVTGAVLRSASGKPRAVLAIGREIEPAAAPLPVTPDLSSRAAPVLEPGVDAGLPREEFESFCRTVSQEFRVPLRIIEGYADIVVEDSGKTLDAIAMRHMNTIREQSRRLSAMIDTTLSLAKIMSRSLRRERLDLSALALDAAAVVRAELHAHDVEVSIQPGLTVEADSALTAHLLRRLFENAFRFSRGSSAPRIEFGQTGAEGNATFFVRDNGSGFDMALSYKLFLPFETLHEGSEAAGTGVGLAEVQRIVARHGGRVWAEAEPGRGAAFYFTLPTGSSSAPPNS